MSPSSGPISSQKAHGPLRHCRDGSWSHLQENEGHTMPPFKTLQRLLSQSPRLKSTLFCSLQQHGRALQVSPTCPAPLLLFSSLSHLAPLLFSSVSLLPLFPLPFGFPADCYVPRCPPPPKKPSFADWAGLDPPPWPPRTSLTAPAICSNDNSYPLSVNAMHFLFYGLIESSQPSYEAGSMIASIFPDG